MANLLLPEQLIRYQACCYDDSGHLAACACERRADSRTSVIHDACCDPIRHPLRPAPAPVVAQARDFCDLPFMDAVLAPIPPYHFAMLIEENLPDRVMQNTGPPGDPQLLPLHCRFNI